MAWRTIDRMHWGHSSIGQYDDDPALGSVKIMDEGRIHEGDRFLFWNVGRMEPSGQLVVYVPGLADVRRVEITEKQFANKTTLARMIRKAANMGEID